MHSESSNADDTTATATEASTTNPKQKTTKSGRKYHFIDSASFTDEQFKRLADEKDDKVRQSEIMKLAKPWETGAATKICRMTLIEEVTSVLLFLFGVPGAAYTLPIIIWVVYSLFGWKIAGTLVVFLATLSFLPAPFRLSTLTSWPAIAILRYFSFKGMFTQLLDYKRPYILVAPPHGVFPFGNIATMIAFPSLCGFPFRGLAASAALRMPVFRQLLSPIGVIDASASSARAALKANHTLGISTGGVAEVFETDTETGDEAIVLKERKGLVKLAIRSGAPLVPCYLFGNTKLFSLYCGGVRGSMGHSLLKSLSRKIGFATVLFWGRFFLPIPYRIPIMGAMGKPIEVKQCSDPTDEYVNEVLQQLVGEMEVLFDDCKDCYGWTDKRLIVN